MIKSSASIALGACLLLAACEGREATGICASFGDPATQLRAFAHDGAGGMVEVRSDVETETVTIVSRSYAAPVLGALWRHAETPFRSLPEVEALPCGLDEVSFVMVTFSDGSTDQRQTSCTGNAIARLTGRVFEAQAGAEIEAEETETVTDIPATHRAICEMAHERF